MIELPDDDRAQGYVRPYRTVYVHVPCRLFTKLPACIAEAFAQNPSLYTTTYCSHCQSDRPVAEFGWKDGNIVGT